jgi:DNA invertase Pin-like site-specific DNA recombinase
MQRLLKMIEDGTVAGVIAWRLDRLTRSIRDLVTLLDLLGQSRGLVSASEQLDTTSAMGRFVVHMLGAIAQWERETIGDRTRMARQHIQSLGYFAGGKIPPGLAIENEGERKRLIRGEYAEILERMWPMVLDGDSMGDIARAMEAAGVPGKWPTVRVNNLLKSRQYIGLLVDESTYESVIAHLKTKQNPQRRKAAVKIERSPKRESPLKGLVRCPTCGKAMVQVTAKGRSETYNYFRCTDKAKQICSQKDIRCENVEERIIGAISEAITGGAYLDALEKELAPLRGAGAKYQEELTALLSEKEQLAARIRDLSLHGPRPGSEAWKMSTTPLFERADELGLEIARCEGSIAAIGIDKQGTEWAMEVITDALERLKRPEVIEDQTTLLEHQKQVFSSIIKQVTPGGKEVILELFLPENAITPAGGEGEAKTSGSFRSQIWLGGVSGKRTVLVRVAR